MRGSTIFLHDINSETLELARIAVQSCIDANDLDFTCKATLARSEALLDADFVINSIEVPPRFELWQQDYEIPRKHGNRQIYGENGGPGGLFHSLRVIPPILDICADIMEISPTALFINYSNPMSRVCLAVHRKFPTLKIVGLCHEIGFAMRHMPKILETPLDNLLIVGGGLNHFGVLLDVRYKDTGDDAYPDIRSKAPVYLKSMHEVSLRLISSKNMVTSLTRQILITENTLGGLSIKLTFAA